MTTLRIPGPFTCSECGRQIPYVVGDFPEDRDTVVQIICFRCAAKVKRDAARAANVGKEAGE